MNISKLEKLEALTKEIRKNLEILDQVKDMIPDLGVYQGAEWVSIHSVLSNEDACVISSYIASFLQENIISLTNQIKEITEDEYL